MVMRRAREKEREKEAEIAPGGNTSIATTLTPSHSTRSQAGGSTAAAAGVEKERAKEIDGSPNWKMNGCRQISNDIN